jgi:integrase
MKGTVRPRPYKAILDAEGKTIGVQPVKGSTWTYQFAVTDGDGKRRQVTKGGYRTKREAEAALSSALAAWGVGDRRATVQPSTQPLGVYLDGWLEARRPGVKPSTHQSYADVVNAWVRPHLGGVPLRDVTAQRLLRLYSELRESGGRGGKALGSRSVQLTATVLRMAFADAVEQGLLARSPVDDIPRRQRPTHRAVQVQSRVWDGDQAAAFLASSSDSRWYPLFAAALGTGMRRGELCGLRWSDVDLEAGTLSVRASRVLVGGQPVEGDPKSGKGRRVDLDAGTVAVLRRWRTVQLEERMAWGPAWVDSGYVFTREDGEPIHPESASTAFEHASKKSELPAIRFHDLRHTHATIALAAGVHPKVVQERLGHADISMTLQLYSHVMPGMGAEAAELVGQRLYGSA